jgi:hypothetical protein
LRSRHGQAARARAVERFSIATMLARYRVFYDHILASAEG